MLCFYADQHFDGDVTQGLRRHGIDVKTAYEDNHSEADDDVLLDRAGELGRVLISQDADLLRLAHEWQETGRPFSGIVFARQERGMKRTYIEQLCLIAGCCTMEEFQGMVMHIPLR